MSIRRFFRPTNTRIRMGVGLVLAVLFCIQCTHSNALRTSALVKEASGPNAGKTVPRELQELEALAKTDHVALLKRCLAHYRKNFQDYECTFVKQERINGQLRPEQWIEVKFMQRPFSVAMRWVKNAPLGDRLVYVEGKYDGQMLVQPKGLLAKLVGTVKRDPESKEVMANTLRPVTMFGFERLLKSLLKVYELAGSRDEATCRFRGYKDVAGRLAMVLERTLPLRKDYPAKTTVWYLDVEHLVPLGVSGTDWDDQKVCSYVYKDVKLNVGLSEDDFAPEANGMQLKN